MAKRGRPKKVTTDETIENIENVDSETIVEEIKEEEVTENTTPSPESEGTKGSYNPFDENVVEREYSTPKVAEGQIQDIEEPIFRPPTYEDIIRERTDTQREEMGSPFDNPNPDVNDLDNRDKQIACESLVDTCLDGYEQLHKLAVHYTKVDEDDLMQRQVKGKIDLNDTIPVSEDGTEMTISEFVGQYNEQSAEALSYDKEFGYKVRPAMVRVFMKKGWGMTDEQYLLYMFGRDIVTKVTIMFTLKKTINSTLDVLEKQHKERMGNVNTQTHTTQSEVIQEEPVQQAEEEVHIVEEVPKKRKRNKTEKFNIDFPQNPKDKMAQHPKEIRSEINKDTKGK